MSLLANMGICCYSYVCSILLCFSGKPGKELRKRTKESRQTPERGPRRLGRRNRGQRGMFRTHSVGKLVRVHFETAYLTWRKSFLFISSPIPSLCPPPLLCWTVMWFNLFFVCDQVWRMTSQPKTESSCEKASVWMHLGKCKVLKKVPGKEDCLLWVRASSHKQNMERHENLVHNKMQTEKALRSR